MHHGMDIYLSPAIHLFAWFLQQGLSIKSTFALNT